MADTKKLRSDIQKLKKALQAKGVSKTVKDKLQGQLDKAETELAASKKPAKSAKPKKSTPLNRLQSLVKRKKYAAYSKAGVDLKKDAGQPALPTGKRTSKSGKTYYEYRANRIDVKQPPKRYPKLAEGGMVNIDDIEVGDYVNFGQYGNFYVVNTDYLLDGTHFWVTRDKKNRTNSDASGYSIYKDDAKYIVEKYSESEDEDNDDDYMAKGGMVDYSKDGYVKAIRDAYGKLLKEVKIGDDIYRYNSVYKTYNSIKNNELLHKSKYADGGMMARGGEINVKGKSIKLKYVKRCCPSIKNDGTIGNYQYDFVDEMGNPFIGYGNSKEEALKSIEEYQNRFASGGYMADGGVIFLKSVSTYFRPSDMTVSSEKSFKNEGEIISLNDVDEEWINKLSVEDNKTIFNAMLSKHYKDSKGMADGGETGRIVMIPTYVVKEIKESVEMGYDTLVEGMIGRKRKGVMLINEDYQVRGTYDIGLKDAIEDLIKKIKAGNFKVDAVDKKSDGGETEKMALGGATVSTQYEKVEGTDYELKIKVYYDKGGISYATYKQEPRGYYLSVSPVQREKRDGYTVESYMAFSGVKTLLLPVQRQSPKAEKQAQEIAEKMMPEMKSYISDKVKEKAGFMKGGGYMAEGGMIKVEEDAYGKSAYIPYKGETFLLEWNTERPTKDSTVISDRSFRRLDEDSSLYQHLLVTLLKAMHENKVQYAEEGAKLAKGGYMAEGGVMSTTHRLSK